MRRIPDMAQLSPLARLAEARELKALSKVGHLDGKLKKLHQEMTDLKSRNFVVETPAAAKQMEAWMAWRTEVLQRMNSDYALLAAERAEAARDASRLVAEKAVIDALQMRSKRAARKAREKRQSYIS